MTVSKLIAVLLRGLLAPRAALMAENLALRQQLGVSGEAGRPHVGRSAPQDRLCFLTPSSVRVGSMAM